MNWKRIGSILASGAVLYFGGTTSFIPKIAEVPLDATIQFATTETVFDTPSGRMEDGFYYQAEDKSVYIAMDHKVFKQAAGYEQAFNIAPAQYTEAHILGYQDRVYYTQGGVTQSTDMYPSRFKATPASGLNILKEAYTVSALEELLNPPKASAAIAFDVTATGGPTTGTALQFTHTASGPNPDIGVAAATLTDSVSGITYNTAALGFVNKTSYPGVGRVGITEYNLANSSTGTNLTVEVDTSISVQDWGGSVSYTGVKQTAQPDATGSGSAGSGNSTCAVTTVADNAWLFMSEVNPVGADTDGTGTKMRQTNANGYGIGDSNSAETPAGTYTLTLNHTSSAWASVCFSLSPALGGSFNPYYFDII